MFGLPEPVTGAMMVAWLLEHVSSVTTPARGCGETWIETRPDDNAPYLMVPTQGGCDYFAGATATRGAVTVHAHLIGDHLAVMRHVDEMRVVAPTGAWSLFPVIYLNPDHPLWTPVPDPGPTDYNHVDRLSMLFHEASHIASNSHHGECGRESPDTNIWFNVTPHTVCDNHLATSAYLVGGVVRLVLAQNCCDSLTRAGLFTLAVAELKGVRLPLRQPLVFPATETFAALGFAGRSFDAVPPEAYLQALALWMDTFLANSGCPCGQSIDDGPAQIRAMWSLAEKEWEAGNVAGPWSLLDLPEPSVVLAESHWAEVWLMRALEAAGSGYNVPLLWVVPCERFGDPACGVEAVGKPGVAKASYRERRRTH